MLKRLLILVGAVIALSGLALAQPVNCDSGLTWAANDQCVLGDKLFTFTDASPINTVLNFGILGNTYILTVAGALDAQSHVIPLADFTFHYTVDVLTPGWFIDSVGTDIITIPPNTTSLNRVLFGISSEIDALPGQQGYLAGLNYTSLGIVDIFTANGGGVTALDNDFGQSNGTPEPATYGLIGLGLIGLAWTRKLVHK